MHRSAQPLGLHLLIVKLMHYKNKTCGRNIYRYRDGYVFIMHVRLPKHYIFSDLKSDLVGLDNCLCVCVCACVCVCVRVCMCAHLSVFHQCVDLLTREAPVELALCDQPSVVSVKVLVARPDADSLVLVKLLASFEKGLDASAAVVTGGAAAGEVLEGLCESGMG